MSAVAVSENCGTTRYYDCSTAAHNLFSWCSTQLLEVLNYPEYKSDRCHTNAAGCRLECPCSINREALMLLRLNTTCVYHTYPTILHVLPSLHCCSSWTGVYDIIQANFKFRAHLFPHTQTTRALRVCRFSPPVLAQDALFPRKPEFSQRPNGLPWHPMSHDD